MPELEDIKGLASNADIQPLVVVTSSDDINKRFATLDQYSLSILEAITKLGVTNNKGVIEAINKELYELKTIGGERHNAIEKMLQDLLKMYKSGQNTTDLKNEVINAITQDDFNQLSKLIKIISKKCDELTSYEKLDDISQQEKLDKIIELLLSRNIISQGSKVTLEDKNILDKLNIYIKEWQQIPVDIARKSYDQMKTMADSMGKLISDEEKQDKVRDEDIKKEIDKVNRKLDTLTDAIAKLARANTSSDNSSYSFSLNFDTKEDEMPKVADVIPKVQEEDFDIDELAKDLILDEDDEKVKKDFDVKKERTLAEGIEVNEIRKYVEFKGHSDSQDNAYFNINFDKPLLKFNNDPITVSFAENFYNAKNYDTSLAGLTHESKTLENGKGIIKLNDDSATVISPMRKKELQELILFHLLTVNGMPTTMKYSNSSGRRYSQKALTDAFPSIAQMGDIRSCYVIDTLGQDNNTYMNNVLKVIASNQSFNDPDSLCVPFRNLGLRTALTQVGNDYEYLKQMKLYATNSQYGSELEYYLNMIIFFQFLNPYTDFDSLEALRSLWSLDLDYMDRKQYSTDDIGWVKGGTYPILNRAVLKSFEYGTPAQKNSFPHLKTNMIENRGQKGYTPWLNKSVLSTEKNGTRKLTSGSGSNDDVASIVHVLASKIDYKAQTWLGKLKDYTGIARVSNIREKLPQLMCGIASHYYTCKRIKLSKVFADQKITTEEVAKNLEGKLYEVQMILFGSASPKDLILPASIPTLGGKKLII